MPWITRTDADGRSRSPSTGHVGGCVSEDLEVPLTTARRREHALTAVLGAVTSENDLQTVLVDIAAAASDLFRAMSAGVFVLEGDEIGMYADFDPSGERTRLTGASVTVRRRSARESRGGGPA